MRLAREKERKIEKEKEREVWRSRNVYIGVYLFYKPLLLPVSVFAACADPHCSDCQTSRNVCDTCMSGYVLSVDVQQCIPCTASSSQCATASRKRNTHDINITGLAVGVSIGGLLFLIITIYGRLRMKRRMYAQRYDMREELLYTGPGSGDGK